MRAESRGRARVLVAAAAAIGAYETYCRARGALEAAVRLRGRAAFAFSGGRTPRPVFEHLAERAGPGWFAWPRLHAYQVDERAVPPDHADSNWRLAAETFLARVPPAQQHRMRGEAEDLEAEAARYADLLREWEDGDGGPRLDLVLLGLGADGHVASLFPHSPALRSERAVAVAEPGLPPRVARLTLTPRVLTAARATLVFVTGPDKADVVRGALEEEGPLEALPARLLRAAGSRVTWILDREAAGRLSSTETEPVTEDRATWGTPSTRESER